MIEFIIISGFISLVFAGIFTKYVLNQERGNEKMIKIADAIKKGSSAFLKRQYRTIGIFTAVVAIILNFVINTQTATSFVVGAVLSALAGYIGMKVSVNANVRCANAANSGISKALNVAFRGGAVNGLSIVGLGILGVSGLYIVFNDPIQIAGIAFGASLVSLFARVGGGIFTKAADVGADLVGKIENNIPEDDPRNPAVIADNVGDNVGDCAGMGADLFESYVVTITAAMILASTANILSPLIAAGAGIIGSIVGIFITRTDNKDKVWGAFNNGILMSTFIAGIIMFFLLPSFNIFAATLVGIITAIIISHITDYYTSTKRKPVKEIAKASETGSATNLIQGISVGMESTFLPVIVICIAILASYFLAGIFGVAMAAVGLLSLTGIIMTIDTFGPISDNAGGIAEMSDMPRDVREVTDSLDAVGNTTKATTKGIAIGSAALSALVLLAAFVQEVNITVVNILNAKVLVGLLIGGSIPFIFSNFLMKSVGKAAHLIVKEVRRQFNEITGLMSGKAEPEYDKVVDISTQAALKELIRPALIAIISPILVGFLLGPEALGAFLTGSVVSGLLLALMLANSGAAWDNAKKYIEAGEYGGKGSKAHKAAIVGDTVGDPSKDTAAPAINSLIKVMNTLAIIIAPLLAIVISV